MRLKHIIEFFIDIKSQKHQNNALTNFNYQPEVLRIISVSIKFFGRFWVSGSGPLSLVVGLPHLASRLSLFSFTALSQECLLWWRKSAFSIFLYTKEVGCIVQGSCRVQQALLAKLDCIIPACSDPLYRHKTTSQFTILGLSSLSAVLCNVIDK